MSPAIRPGQPKSKFALSGLKDRHKCAGLLLVANGNPLQAKAIGFDTFGAL